VTLTTALSSSIRMSRIRGVSEDPDWSCGITSSDPDTSQTPAAWQPRAGSPRHENVSAPDGFRVGVSANAAAGSAQQATNTPIPNRAKADPFTARDPLRRTAVSQWRNFGWSTSCASAAGRAEHVEARSRPLLPAAAVDRNEHLPHLDRSARALLGKNPVGRGFCPKVIGVIAAFGGNTGRARSGRVRDGSRGRSPEDNPYRYAGSDAEGSRRHVPDRPPDFSSSTTEPISAPRWIPLTMS
jgi:hypothetical protein